MNALRQAWESQRGEGSVKGLAPSAAAAQVLAEDLGIPTENTAMWIAQHRRGDSGFQVGELVIVDEASLAGTFTLDTITAHAAQAGSKVLLVGDWAQLDAVDAGGAFGMLVRDRDDVPELVDVHRFRNEWEKTASLQLRVGDPSVIDTYQKEGRIREGNSETMLDAVYTAWRTDLADGLVSVMIAETHDVVTALNNRRLRAGRGFVKNGDRWIVTATRSDGSATRPPPNRPRMLSSRPSSRSANNSARTRISAPAKSTPTSPCPGSEIHCLESENSSPLALWPPDVVPKPRTGFPG